MEVLRRARRAVVAVCLGITGCAGLHDYAAPELPVIDAPKRLAENVDTSAQMTLAQAYRLALAYSEQDSIATAQVTENEVQLDATLNDVRPNISLTASGAIQIEKQTPTAMPVILQPPEEVTSAARLQQPLFRRGFEASRDAAKLGIESARASLEREREQLERDVVEVFVDVIQARGLLDLAKASLERTQKQLDHAVGRIRAGEALRNAELLASVDVKRADVQLVAAQRDVGLAEAAFRRLIGRPAPQDLVLPPPPPPPALDQANALVRRRTDLKALELDVSQSRAAEDAVRGRRWWPRLDLFAFVQGNYPEVLDLASTPGSGKNLDWQVLGLLTIPLYQSGREYTDLSLQEIRTRVATLSLEQRRKVATEEVEQAELRLSSANQIADFSNEQLKSASDNYKLVDNQFRSGAVTFLDVTTAQAVLVEAENAQERAKMDQVRALYELLFAVGAIDLASAAP